ncbi:hypothetical protein SAMN05216215_100792 [Saccharopolyspora shandongensis]|uniref:Uncharacterized protein n=1 Tax=Saccharopolyspora shandongensis TaxID=418495 RepID=A0A1H2YMG1_9PSEU|nr:hypothetical protein [Saccharopolyspora shandongensis]SDX06413.1 hypothetical protein SAMN05216215_100792 [Saccharopolyspora shandongensis]
MDAKTYAAVTDVCARLAGRLSDDTLGVVRDQYAAGESDLAESTLLLNLEGEGVGITREEQDLIRSALDDPGNPDLDDVPVIDAVPPLQYRFSPAGPADAPDPSRADIVLSTDAPRHGGHRLRRAWREPLAGAPDAAAWVYVLQVAEGTDQLSAYAGLSSRLWVALKEKWPLEVVVEGKQLPQYQAAALTAAHQIWSA